MRKPCPSDLTEEQWEIIQPLILVNTVGRPRTVEVREVLYTIFSLIRSGCQWDMLPHDLPPRSTVHDSSSQWRCDGNWQEIMDALRRRVRVAVGKGPSPSAGSSVSPTVKATESVDGRGADGDQKVTGRKRHIVVDTLGWLLVVVVTTTSAADGTSALEVRARLSAEHRSRRELLWAASMDQNHRLEGWLEENVAGSRIEGVRRPPWSKGEVKLPRRWVVEPTFAWLGLYRRNRRGDERSAGSSEAMIKVSSIHRMLRLLKPPTSKKPVPFKYRELQGKITG
ncbi:MAG: IS5 family transposase [Planctomycetaceae bacterium]|nr:IS5 family transposase [Planctomycetaceae bacterium]